MQPYEELEVSFAKWAGVENVACVSSGTAGLHTALEVLQLPPGSEVITCDFNMIAAPRSIILAGHTPVFVDCGNDLLIDTDLLDEALSQRAGRVRAILVPYIYGRKPDSAAIADLAKKYDAAIIEDLAEAHGVAPHPNADAVVWSFFRNKLIASEEGGAIAFRKPEHAKLARQLRCMGFTDAHDFMHLPRGHNYRLANCLAVLALESLRNYPVNLLARRQAERWYDERCPEEWKMPARLAPWIFDIRVPGMTKDKQNEVVRALQADGVAARHAFQPMSKQLECVNFRRFGGRNAERLGTELFYLPLTPGAVTEESADRAFATIRRVLA